MSADLWFMPQLDVVAVEFFDRARSMAPVHRIAVTFRDGAQELVDVKAASHHGAADVFAAAIPEAISQRRTSVALQAQYEHIRTQWFKQLGCRHLRTKSIAPSLLNSQATFQCLDCDSLGRGLPPGGIEWRGVFDDSQGAN